MTTNNRHLVGSNLVGEVLPGARHLLGEVWDKISGNISDSEKRREFASKKLAETLARANAEKLVLAESPTVPESGLTDLTSLIDARDRVIVFPFPGSAIYKRDMKKWSEKCARSIPGDFPFFRGAGSVAVRGVVGENDGRCPESKRLVNYLSEFANKYGIGAEPDGQAVVTLPRSVLGIHDDPNVNN